MQSTKTTTDHDGPPAASEHAEGMREERATLAPDDLLCVTGSVYLAGIARRVLRQDVRPRRAGVGRRQTRAVHGDP